jgi:LmbE family N-acetylglucosaminyl deacetylase
MYPELDLVPFTPGSLSGERLLVLAPHPDDEVIGCGGLIGLHALEKRQVRVLVLSDGAESGVSAETRERETVAGLSALNGPHPEFLRLPDRRLAAHSGQIQQAIREQILNWHPDLIACPAPTEIHPDHVAVARALVDLIQRDQALLRETAVAQIAFYEVSQPFRPNTLVDITDVAEQKYTAIRAHASQTALRDYDAYARGLNRYRSMTLSQECRYAEAYWVAPLSSLHTTPWTTLRQHLGPAPPPEVVHEPLPITVVVRTKDRLSLLQEALESIVANDYPAEVVVVNDGGEPVGPVAAAHPNALLIEHPSSRGRSEAMNAGVRAAATPYIAFLDDDDLYYPDHLRTLAAAITTTGRNACYSDALSVYYELGESGELFEKWRLRQYAQPFDPELLLIDNYIPLPSLLLRKEDYLEAGGFDPAFDLFEDWEFLLRLARRGAFVRVPRVTCEVRHFPASGSIVAAAPSTSAPFLEAKLAIWKRHFDPPDLQVVARVFERKKASLLEASGVAAEQRGRALHLEKDLQRLDREKTILLEELRETGSARMAAQSELEVLSAEAAGLRLQVADAMSEIARLSTEVDRVSADLGRMTGVADERDQIIRQLYQEIDRLNGLLETIYRSRTWKLHQTLASLRGKA